MVASSLGELGIHEPGNLYIPGCPISGRLSGKLPDKMETLEAPFSLKATQQSANELKSSRASISKPCSQGGEQTDFRLLLEFPIKLTHCHGMFLFQCIGILQWKNMLLEIFFLAL